MNKNLIKGILYNTLSIISLFFPIAILFIIKWDEWVTVQESIKVSMGAIIGLGYAIFVMRGALKDMAPKTATLISMSTFLIIIWFFDSLLNDLFWIVLALICGYVLYIIISYIGQKHIESFYISKDEKIRVKIRKEANDDLIGV
jgi:hypothetical protein